jgi:hypothetical protein
MLLLHTPSRQFCHNTTPSVRGRRLAAEGPHEVTLALRRVAGIAKLRLHIGAHSLARHCQQPLRHRMGTHLAPERRAERDHLRDEVRPGCGDPAGQQTTFAVADDRDPAADLSGDAGRAFDQPSAQFVGTADVPRQRGLERLIADPLQPAKHRDQVQMAAEKTGNNQYGSSIIGA